VGGVEAEIEEVSVVAPVGASGIEAAEAVVEVSMHVSSCLRRHLLKQI